MHWRVSFKVDDRARECENRVQVIEFLGALVGERAATVKRLAAEDMRLGFALCQLRDAVERNQWAQVCDLLSLNLKTAYKVMALARKVGDGNGGIDVAKVEVRREQLLAEMNPEHRDWSRRMDPRFAGPVAELSRRQLEELMGVRSIGAFRDTAVSRDSESGDEPLSGTAMPEELIEAGEDPANYFGGPLDREENGTDGTDATEMNEGGRDGATGTEKRQFAPQEDVVYDTPSTNSPEAADQAVGAPFLKPFSDARGDAGMQAASGPLGGRDVEVTSAQGGTEGSGGALTPALSHRTGRGGKRGRDGQLSLEQEYEAAAAAARWLVNAITGHSLSQGELAEFNALISRMRSSRDQAGGEAA